ncbi:MAG: DNA primase [Arcobacteraceae bacterium]|jgi:DNA primase|nr:DNA primase [Arcobacteraceae bacterium]
MITKNSIENLKNTIDIVDILGSFIQVKKSGANFKACCPFHGEKTPSFVISPAKQIYHCFGCGVGGDAIKFVMEFEKLSYPEAIEKVALLSNFSLEYDDNYKKQDYSVIEKLNEYYQKLLSSNDTVNSYLKERGISSFSIEKFELGFAPSSNETVNYLKNNFLNLADGKDFGLIDYGQNGVYSRFIDRITFPIYSANNQLVGFGGRTISGHSAKYINSPQTKYFNKSKLLYGYNIAKEHIFKEHKIIVTEGYLDVIMLHQAGFKTAVATLGTALTAEHLPLLKRSESKIILAYDGDSAGLNAAFKASTLLSHNSFDGGVVIFGDNFDPADMVKNRKIEQLNEMFLHPKPFVEYCIDFISQNYDLFNPNEKQKALNEINEYFKNLSPIMQQSYQTYVSSKLNINSSLVNLTKEKSRNHQRVQLTQIDIAELSIIKTLLETQSLLNIVLNVINEEMFTTHRNEFNIFLHDKDDPTLRGILLQEEVKIYNVEELKNQLMLLLVPFYNKKLQNISSDKEIDFKEKTRKIRILKDNIEAVKKGEMNRIQKV